MAQRISPSAAATSAPTVVVTVTAPDDQPDLTPRAWSVAVTVDEESVDPSAISWSTPTGTSWDDDEIATPTMTPTAGGELRASCTVTIDGRTYQDSASWTVGVQDTESGGWWVEDWSSAGLTHNFLVDGGTVVHDGVTLNFTYSATAPTEAAFTDGALAIDTVNGYVGVWISAAYTVNRHVRWGMALDAGLLTANDDAAEIVRVQAPLYFYARAFRTGGAQTVTVLRDGTPDEQATAGGGQVRVLELEQHGYCFRTLYSETAFDGTYKAPSAMSKHNDVASGWYVCRDVGPTATEDAYDATSKVYLEGRGDNGRRYTFPQLYRLIKT